jgi:hypothetical protein
MKQSLSSEANNSHSDSQEIPHFYGTWRFITVIIRACHWPYPEPDESSPYLPTLFQYILMAD